MKGLRVFFWPAKGAIQACAELDAASGLFHMAELVYGLDTPTPTSEIERERPLTYRRTGSRHSRSQRIESVAACADSRSFWPGTRWSAPVKMVGKRPLTELWISCYQLLLCSSRNGPESSIDAGSSGGCVHTMVAQQAVAISCVGRRVTGSTRLFFSPSPPQLERLIPPLVHAR
jgi:hypothetical protein